MHIIENQREVKKIVKIWSEIIILLVLHVVNVSSNMAFPFQDQSKCPYSTMTLGPVSGQSFG